MNAVGVVLLRVHDEYPLTDSMKSIMETVILYESNRQKSAFQDAHVTWQEPNIALISLKTSTDMVNNAVKFFHGFRADVYFLGMDTNNTLYDYEHSQMSTKQLRPTDVYEMFMNSDDIAGESFSQAILNSGLFVIDIDDE